MKGNFFIFILAIVCLAGYLFTKEEVWAVLTLYNHINFWGYTIENKTENK